MNKFELEIWSDTAKMKRVLVYIVIITIVAWIVHVCGNIFWEKYTRVVTNLRGVTMEKGWPVTAYWWGMFIGIIGPISFVIILLAMKQNVPSLALNKDGLFINQQLIKQKLVNWSDISRIERGSQGDTIIMNVYFKDSKAIIASQSSTRQTFLKENLKDGKPLACNNRLMKGDFEAFIVKANEYLRNS